MIRKRGVSETSPHIGRKNTIASVIMLQMPLKVREVEPVRNMGRKSGGFQPPRVMRRWKAKRFSNGIWYEWKRKESGISPCAITHLPSDRELDYAIWIPWPCAKKRARQMWHRIDHVIAWSSSPNDNEHYFRTQIARWGASMCITRAIAFPSASRFARTGRIYMNFIGGT